MDFYVVADEDTVLGFRYAGVPGVIVSTEAEAGREFDRLAESEAQLIVITTEQVADTVRERVNAIRFKAARRCPSLWRFRDRRGRARRALRW